MKSIFALGLFISLLSAFPVNAESPCGDKKGIEHTICISPELTDLNAKMNDLYKAAQSILSADGQAALNKNQQEFISYANKACKKGGVFILDQWREKTSSENCLKSLLAERNQSLSMSTKTEKGRVFLLLTIYRIKPSLQDSEKMPAIKEKATIVQLDAPKTDSEKKWNESMRNWVSEKNGLAYAENGDGFEKAKRGVDADLTENVYAVSPDLVSSQLSISSYSGGAHGQYNSYTKIWSFKLDREINKEDLFYDAANPELKKLICSKFKISKDELNCEFTLQDNQIVVLPDGIVINFDPYVLGGYLSAGKSKLEWSEVRPFLKDDLPFSIKNIEAVQPYR